MSDSFHEHQFDDDEEGFIFVDGERLEFDTIASAIEALARDEAFQADEARRLGRPECREGVR